MKARWSHPLLLDIGNKSPEFWGRSLNRMLVVFGVPPCLLLMVGNTGLVHQDGAEDDEPDELCQTTSIWQKVSTTTDEYSGRV